VRILVTGGFGFIGSSFCRLASVNGHELIILDKMTYAADSLNLPTDLLEKSDSINCDIADSSALQESFNRIGEFDWIVNFAAESHVDRSIKDGAPFVNSNVLGVVNILEYMKSNPKIKLLQVSTDEVFGTIDSGSWDTDVPLNPRSAYSSSKASAEMFCNAYKNTHGLRIVITRCANNFGPRQSAEKLVPTIIRSALSDKQIPLYGKGENRREWIFVDDHAAAILKIVESDTTKHSKYNIGGNEKSNLEVVRLFLSCMNKSEDLISYVEDRPGHDFRYSVNDSKYRTEFGNYITGELEDQIKITINWYLENQDWLQRSLDRLKR
jgi:dTDP-glucose 4,6-dehydratase